MAASQPGSDPRDVDPARWLHEHGDALFGFALLMVQDRGAAEDLVQDTFLSALRGVERFRGEATERTWLISILKHKAIDHLRRRQPASTEPVEGIDDFFGQGGKWKNAPGDWTPGAAGAWEQREFHEALRDCLDVLPANLLQPMLLRDMEGMDSADVCKVLGLTPTNLWTRLHRARMLLRRCLEASWFHHRESAPRDNA
jgi:RNA polymerase sigma-70 factor (ECF subfamily)